MPRPTFHALGFSQVVDASQGRPATSFFNTWLYRHDYAAQDGGCLYLALPFGVPRWRLSLLPWPLVHQDILLDLVVDDEVGLGQAVEAFFAAHGGRGHLIPAPPRQRPPGFPVGPTR